MRSCGYWLSPSVLTTMSAPSSSARWTPSWKERPSPRLRACRTKWTTPCSRATSTVRSVDPSSMMSTTISSMPGISRGIVDSTAGRVSSSLRQGTWTTRRTAASPGLRGPDDRPRVRRGDLAHRGDLGDEALEARARPVVEVARGVAQVLEVAAGEQVGAAEERLVRHRQQQVAGGDPGQLAQPGGGVAQVLEHLDADHQVELLVAERQLLGVGVQVVRARAGCATGPAARASGRSSPTQVPKRSCILRLMTPSPAPTSSGRVAGSRVVRDAGQQAVEPGDEALGQPPDRRVLRRVLLGVVADHHARRLRRCCHGHEASAQAPSLSGVRPPPWLGRVARAGFLVLAVGLLLGYLWSEREGAAEAVRDIGPGYALTSLTAVLVGLLASMSVWRALLADLGRRAVAARGLPRLLLRPARQVRPGQRLRRGRADGAGPRAGRLAQPRRDRQPGLHGRRAGRRAARRRCGPAADQPRRAAAVRLGAARAARRAGRPGAAGADPRGRPAPAAAAPSAARAAAVRPGRGQRPSAGRWSCGWPTACTCGCSSGRRAPTRRGDLLLATGGYALAWTVGFLFVIAPAGAGVRELALVAALAPVVDRPAALAVALLSRVLMTLGDLVLGAGGAAVRPRNGHGEGRDGAPVSTVTAVQQLGKAADA